MARMSCVAQAVDDPEIEIFEKRPALGRNIADIGRVSAIPDPIPQRRDAAVREDERRYGDRTALPLNGPAFTGFDRMAVQDWWIIAALRRDEAIGKPRQHVFRGGLVEINRNAPALMQHHGTQIIDPVGLVGVLM